MSNAATSKQATPDEAKREGTVLRKVAEALTRANLPGDLTERTKADPGAPFEHAEALATMRRKVPADWARVKTVLKAAGVAISDLEKAMGTGAGENGDGKQGRPVTWDAPEPWPKPVDGAALLNDIAAFIRRHVSLSSELADSVTLWIVMTWIHDRLDISTFLNVTSATKQCGKSLLIEVLGELVHKPLLVGGRLTSSALFRTISKHAPTMLLDEADTFFSDDEELRGVVNGSQRRNTAYVLRCVGDDHEPRQFVTWCPKAMAGIGGLPDTVLDRSIVVRLERRPPNVAIGAWRDRDKNAIEVMRRKLVRWIGDYGASIVARLSAVVFPPELHDRARDAWEALLAIADEADDKWTGEHGRAWNACHRAMADCTGAETGAREMLLADLRDVFQEAGWPEAISSKTLLARLHAMEGRRWGEWSRGQPMTGHALARLLNPFGIASRNHRFPDGTQSKAYFATAFESAWESYFPESGGFKASQRPQAAIQGDSGDFNPSRPDPLGTDADRTKPCENRDWDAGTLRSPRNNPTAPAPVSLPPQPPNRPMGEAYRKARDGE